MLKSVDWPVAIALTALLIIATVAAFAMHHFAVPTVFNPFHVRMFDIQDTGVQRKAYAFLLVMTFALFFTAAFVRRPSFPSLEDVTQKSWFPRLYLIFFIIGIIALLKGYHHRISYALIYLLGYTYLCRKSWKIAPKLLTVVAAAVLCGLFVAPLFFSFGIPADSLWVLDHHWSGIVGEGILSALMPQAPHTLIPQYGILLNALVHLVSGIAQEPYAAIIFLLQAANLLCGGLIFLTAYQRVGGEARQKNLAVAALTTCVLGAYFWPYLSGWASSFITPNLTGLRFAMLFVSAALAPYIMRLEVMRAAAVSAVLAALCLLYNLETGIVCMVGMGFALFVKAMPLGGRGLAKAAAGYLPAFAVGLILFGLHFLQSLPARGGHQLDMLISLFSSGYGGIRIVFYMPFFLMMGHTFYLFARRLMRIRKKDNVQDLQGDAMIAMILCLGPYIMNRFAVANMWTSMCLYALLLVPRISVQDLRRNFVLGFYILVLILPVRVRINMKTFEHPDIPWRFGHAGKTCLYGVSAPADVCDYLAHKSAALKKEASAKRVLWMSATPLTMTLKSGVPPATAHLDPFAFSRDAVYYHRVLTAFRMYAPQVIMIDKNNGAGIPYKVPAPMLGWQVHALHDLGYRITKETPYWRIAVKQDDGEKP